MSGGNLNKKFHFIGIGGIGMSSLARILLERGCEVSGSDLVSSSIIDSLELMGAKISIGQKAENISPSQVVVFSSDIKQTNPEYQAAVELKCAMEHRSECLLRMTEGQRVLAVGGTHGKTTTSSLLAWVMEVCGLMPTFSIGGVVKNFQTNGKAGQGMFFVAEADESDGTLVKYHPYGAIVTNIGLDHMSHYHTEDILLDCFRTFFSQIQNPECSFWCGDDERLQAINPVGISYGFGDRCLLKASNFRQIGWKSVVDIQFKGRIFTDVEVALAGKHNILNTLAVFGLLIKLGASEVNIREGLKTFQGIGRRCEIKGEKNGILFLDDYAHHPTEIKATLNAIKDANPNRRIIAVFQPHRYTRTRDCMGTYGTIFNSADQVFLTDIHSAGETPIAGVEVVHILNEIKRDSKTGCRYLPREDLSCKLPQFLEKGDVVVTLGAGNITNVGTETMESFIEGT